MHLPLIDSPLSLEPSPTISGQSLSGQPTLIRSVSGSEHAGTDYATKC